MPLSFAVPELSTTAAERLLQQRFGVSGTCTPLDGERDRNFMVSTAEGSRYVFKVAGAGEDGDFLDLQRAVLNALQHGVRGVETPRIVPTTAGESLVAAQVNGATHFLRLLTWIDGKPLAQTRPHSPALLRSLGAALGEVNRCLATFSHPAAQRSLKWDLVHAGWIVAELQHVPNEGRRQRLARHMEDFAARILPRLRETRAAVIHGDANDWNVLTRAVDGDAAARVVGLIDLGDLVLSHTVCDLAVALAYAMMDKPDPISAAVEVVAGFHDEYALTEDELALLLPLVRTRLSVTVTNAALQRVTQPDNEYLSVSEAGAWRLLDQLEAVNDRYANYRLRDACGLPPVPTSARVSAWLAANRNTFAPIVSVPLDGDDVPVLDLSVGSDDLGPLDEWQDVDRFTRKLFGQLRDDGAPAAIGRYDEVRALYASDGFGVAGNDGPEYRAVHIGLDVFQEAGAPVFAPLAGIVHSLRDNDAPLDYGPTIIVQHSVEDGALPFYTLYGHLSRESLPPLRAGQRVRAGEQIATLGDQRVNGGWPSHLHFQVICDLL
ncbi:MAG: phosphotransferase, partial [Gemmatimonadaceae bacterium]